jgi:hypothetical protein
LLKQNFLKVVNTVFQLENCKQLQNYCLESICEDPEPYFNSSEFPTLEKNALLEIIKSEDLQIEESKLWEHLIRWGIFQTSELKEFKSSINLSNWNEKHFLVLENTLNQFILYIRFFEMSSKNFYEKVWPFKELLPKTLCEDILSFHMAGTRPRQYKLPPRFGKIIINSKIINSSKHAKILANWIQRKDANVKIPKDVEYNFNLIYRASQDGYDINTIRSKCNDHIFCILIIKIKPTGTIIGGYNPFGWKNAFYFQQNILPPSFLPYQQNEWHYTTESFIFSLGNNSNDLKDIKISRVVNSNFAIYEPKYRNVALNFGNCDLIINNNTGTCNHYHYESSILDNNYFLIEDMEILKFTK